MLQTRDKFSKAIFCVFSTCLLTQFIAKVHAEEYIYGSESNDPENNIYGSEMVDQENNCQSNELPASITPDVYGNIQLQALRSRLWRILSSPSLNENTFSPNYESLSDGKLLYDLASQNGRNWWHPNFKRNIGAILKSKPIPHLLKKSIATLAKNGQLPTSHLPEDEIEDEEDVKRNIAALAKSKSQFLKRSLQALAKNSHFPDNKQSEDLGNYYYEYNLDQLPSHPYGVGKKNIGSLARMGTLQNNYNNANDDKRNIQYVMKNGGVVPGGKRNLASLLRNHNMPETIKEDKNDNDKRNIGAIARDWALPNHSTGFNKNSEDKRNIAASLLQDSYSRQNPGAEIYPSYMTSDDQFELKRNLASIKAGKRDIKRSVPLLTNKDKNGSNKENGRKKRQADEYFTENAEDYNPLLHKSNGNDYDELVRMFAGDYFYNQKRFLGNIPLSRMTELGKISLMSQPHVSNATPTSPTYRRKQYLLSRTIPVEPEEK